MTEGRWLRVIARTKAGNPFAHHVVSSHDEALAIALKWIRWNPGLTVEIAGLYD